MRPSSIRLPISEKTSFQQFQQKAVRLEIGRMTPKRILETCLYVDDLEKAEHFYKSILGLEVIRKEKDKHIFFKCGEQVLLLFGRKRLRSKGELPWHNSNGCIHLAFAIEGSETDAWKKKLAEEKIEILSEFTWPSGGHSVYFADPDGNLLELTSPCIWGFSN